MQFFGKTGISQTEAISLANRNAERVKEIVADLNRINPVSEYLIRNDRDLSRKTKNLYADHVIGLVDEHAKLNRFSAWLREAVSRKVQLLKEVEEDKFVSYVKQEPLRPYIKEVDQQWVLDKFTVKEMGEYLGLEAEAAVYGKLFHNDGLVSQWQEDCSQDELREHRGDLISCPLEQRATEDVNKVKRSLFSKHRDITKKLNAYKARIEKEVNSENSRIKSENAIIAAQNKSITDSHNALIEQEKKKFEETKLKKIQEVAAYKIEIPNEFKSLLDTEI